MEQRKSFVAQVAGWSAAAFLVATSATFGVILAANTAGTAKMMAAAMQAKVHALQSAPVWWN